MPGGFFQIQAVAAGDGPTITAAAATSALPVTAKFTFAPNTIGQQTVLRISAQGRISNAVTTPGTARIDVRLGGTVIYDTGAFILNQVVKANVPWWFDAVLVCRAIGATGNFFGFGKIKSESIVGSPLGSVGGSGDLVSAGSGGPSAAPVIGGNVDLTVSNTFDMFFTQTVTTGSFTVHAFLLETGTVLTA
jgi:hypothetical protein